MSDPDANHVSITDFNMPFLSMVRFMVKWSIAAIPAIFIIMLAAALFWGVALGVATGVGAAFVRNASGPATPAVEIPEVTTISKNQTGSGDAQAYLNQVIVSGIRVGRGDLGQTGVFGEVKNAGDRTLKEVEITIYCLDAGGKPVFEQKYHPVLVTDLSFGDEAELLKPGYSRRFGVKMDDAPSDWSKKVEVKVTSIAFQEGDT